MSRRIIVLSVMVVMVAIAAMGQLSAPTIQTTTADATGIQVSYLPVVDANDYDAQVYTLNNVRLAVAQTTKLNLDRVTSTVTGVPAGTQVIVKMVARKKDSASNVIATSAPSAPASVYTAPAPPTNIKGLGGLLKVTVSWTASPGAASYQLTLSNGMSFTTNSTSYTVTGLQTATSYNVIVAGITAAGDRGAFSPAVAVRTANVALQ